MPNGISEMSDELADQIHQSDGVYVTAPAGYGKTHLIAYAISRNQESRQLILTHTVAGVASIRSKILEMRIASSAYYVTTIAGWCQKYVLSYPELSGLTHQQLESADTRTYWNLIYSGMLKLLANQRVTQVIKNEYEGVYVDEYQDCTTTQHSIVKTLMPLLPVRVLGDPMQGIFAFTREMIDWPRDVEGTFSHMTTLATPHRWNNAGNHAYGNWIQQVRSDIQASNPIDLSQAPACVSVHVLSGDAGVDSQEILKLARSTLAHSNRLIIGDTFNRESKELVKRLSRPRYVLLESLDSPEINEIRAFAEVIDSTDADANLAFVELLGKCFTGMSSLKRAAREIVDNPAYKPVKPLYKAFVGMTTQFDADVALRILKLVDKSPQTSCHRWQLLSVIEMMLSSYIAGEHTTLSDSVEAAIESVRHRGRKLPKYSIGSTLLVKGLQVDEVLLINAHKLSPKDLYVALSRPVKKLVVVSESTILTP